tara:strand:+ start:935 stop:1366 length:432 start_codon:yes stop_codon:yes gene_type:complete
MAGLNLTPNPYVIATQAGIFLTSLHFVRALFVKPYLEMKEKRDQATVGDQDSISLITDSNKAKSAEIEKMFRSAIDEMHVATLESRNAGTKERDLLVKAAEERAQSYLFEENEKLKNELSEELKKVPALVAKLSDAVFDKTLA